MTTQRTNQRSPGDIEQALRDLPACEPSALQMARWTQVAQRTQGFNRWLPIGLAATVLLALGIAFDPTPRPAPETVAQTPVAMPAEDQDLAVWVARAALLEQRLAALPSQGTVRSVAGAGAVVSLEDRLEQIDAALDQPASSDSAGALWKARVDVMSALVDLKRGGEPAIWL
ncbi:MAG: hypothetical protein AAGA84_07185 [Pseudomonadota bacterium]